MYIFTGLIVIPITLLLYVYLRLKKAHRYFDGSGIPHFKPTSFLGSMPDVVLFRKINFQGYFDLYKKAASHRFAGFYDLSRPFILVRDPDLIKQILIKDFDYFADRTISVKDEVHDLGKNLFTLTGHDWKNLRIKLTSTFSSGKMRMMFPLIETCAKLLTGVLGELAATGEEFEGKDLFGRYATDVIGTCAFGVEPDSLQNPNSEFNQMGKRMLTFRPRQLLKLILPTKLPVFLMGLLDIEVIPNNSIFYFKSLIERIVKHREKNHITRYDFLDLLIALKNNKQIEKDKDQYDEQDWNKYLQLVSDKRAKSNIDMTIDVIVSQCLVFFVAGFEGAATNLNFVLLELAHNKEIQNKLRKEITSVLDKHDGLFTYDLLPEMPYLDMVLSEALRKYIIGMVDRQCSKNYQVPGTDVVIKKGTQVIVSLYGLHHDPQYYEKPEEFYPEHFTEEAKAQRHNFAYIPFSEGPRICIGERFAKMQVKIALVHALKNYEFELSPRMKMPLEYANSITLVNVKGGTWLKCKKI